MKNLWGAGVLLAVSGALALAPTHAPALNGLGVALAESGRYEAGTLKILNSSNSQFTAAVKDALPRMRFSAAQIGGKKVQQLVQMPFQFHITH